MADIVIKFDLKDAPRELDAYRHELTGPVVARSINKTLTSMRAEGARLLSEKVGLPINEMRRRLFIRRARPDFLEGALEAGGSERVPLSAFKATQRGKRIRGARRRGRAVAGGGVSARIGKTTVFIPHAFIIQRKKRAAVMIRAPSFKAQMYDAVSYRANRMANKGSDMPIAEIFAPGPKRVFVERAIIEALGRVARTRFPQVIAQEVNFMRVKGR